MTTKAIYRPVLLAPFVLLAGCRAESDPAAPKLQTMSFANSEWFEPVNLGPVVNSSSNVTIRADGRELLFWSPRAGGPGGNDLCMSTRQTIHDSCSPPVNAGTALNSVFDDVTPSLSWDGRTLSFASNRPGGSGGNDLYMSTRTPSGQE